ncbi:unnamed protein product [Penicillium salamii]|uniref:Uncharacterized protein n=1 Tax=Penicillium salamii TaxID=1612424 RepID=A0A9W4NA17_9EURO|nr:unnamed protein product [Penicillium salamii]CAG8043857.1 unnamed protein product [Penicillium salamii]CAG8334619.1 unnamed protein product [Penicillium salamii]CAG8334902.1 unnamed protein product [Penicillium salamii]CAG8343323.1 unnamed protein product [Penicillium salamii]
MNFVQDVENTDKAQSWRKPTIRLEEKNDGFQDEHFEVGDEAGFQSRFTQHFGESHSCTSSSLGTPYSFVLTHDTSSL